MIDASTAKHEQYGFADFDLDAFPVLARAVANEAPAVSTKIEWLMPDRTVAKNYTQIFRVPYTHKHGDQGMKAKKLNELLQCCERALEHGAPSSWKSHNYQYGTCGGYRHYLGRDLTDADRISLRVLRSPVWRERVGEYDEVNDYTQTDEWLCEISLEVVPG